MDKKKVLFVSFQANLSGAPRILYNIVKHIDREKFDCCVVFPERGPIVAEFQAIVPSYVISSPVDFAANILNRRRISQKLRRRSFNNIVAKTSPDAIYINGLGQKDVVEWAVDLPLPKIVHFHEIDNAVMVQADKWLQKIVANCNLFVACCHAVRNFMVRCMNISPQYAVTMHESIDVEAILARKCPHPHEIKKKFRIPVDATIIGAVGQPSFRKGVDIFVEAAAAVLHHKPNLNLHFVWVGGNNHFHNSLFMKSMRNLVKRCAMEKRFHWIREVQDVTPLQNAMDLYVVSSREDPFPLGMLEAMLMGTPVIGFAVSGVPEALGHGAGIIVDRADASSLAEKIMEFVDARDKWVEIGNNGNTRVGEQFAIADNIKVIEETLQRLNEL